MFIELVDLLRCTGAHEETWLVASTGLMTHRHIVEGSLGCPTCRAVYPIHRGVVDFSGGELPAAVVSPDAGAGDASVEDDALRLAALLGLSEPNQRVLLIGDWGRLAGPLLAIVPAELLLVDPPADVDAGEGRSPIRCGARPVPLMAEGLRAAALDGPTAHDPARARAAVRAVRAGGRVVGPADAPLPAEVRELARDDRHWVGEREATASAPVPLRILRNRP